MSGSTAGRMPAATSHNGGGNKMRPGGVPGRRARSSRIPDNPVCAPVAGWPLAVPRARYSVRGLFALLNLLFVLHSPRAASPLWLSPWWCCPDSCAFGRPAPDTIGEGRRCQMAARRLVVWHQVRKGCGRRFDQSCAHWCSRVSGSMRATRTPVSTRTVIGRSLPYTWDLWPDRAVRGRGARTPF
jgi:hypothetical protein